jgi:hypothetical protein
MHAFRLVGMVLVCWVLACAPRGGGSGAGGCAGIPGVQAALAEAQAWENRMPGTAEPTVLASAVFTATNSGAAAVRGLQARRIQVLLDGGSAPLVDDGVIDPEAAQPPARHDLLPGTTLCGEVRNARPAPAQQVGQAVRVRVELADTSGRCLWVESGPLTLQTVY